MLCISYKDEQDKSLTLKNVKPSAKGKYKEICYVAISKCCKDHDKSAMGVWMRKQLIL